ncbi:hypothetical protein [Caldibacillus thermoamylovorans]|nr:hypothetical protein [Caldibacillus thermoamylovorans]
MTTRMNLVVKKWGFPAENGDEKGSRRQKMEFRPQKCRREQASSPKKRVFRLKMTTRMGFVAKKGVFRLKMATRKVFVVKKWSFSAQNDDENESRRQKMGFSG